MMAINICREISIFATNVNLKVALEENPGTPSPSIEPHHKCGLKLRSCHLVISRTEALHLAGNLLIFKLHHTLLISSWLGYHRQCLSEGASFSLQTIAVIYSCKTPASHRLSLESKCMRGLGVRASSSDSPGP